MWKRFICGLLTFLMLLSCVACGGKPAPEPEPEPDPVVEPDPKPDPVVEPDPEPEPAIVNPLTGAGRS